MKAGTNILATAAALTLAVAAAASHLTTLDYKILGTQLRVSPAMVSVPKGVAGSVVVEVVGGSSSNRQTNLDITRGAHIEATFRGPSFPARRIVGRVNEAMLLPPLNLVGDYQLDGVKLVDSVTGAVRLEGTPNSVPVHVFDEVLVSRVTSRPLSLDEIKEKGIVIDELSFRAVEFQVMLTLRGRTFPVHFPVVAPASGRVTEIIPAAELEERLAEAERINAQLAQTVELPPELETAKLNIEIKGVNFEGGGGLGFEEPTGPPPIAGILVIPGKIGFLGQFFSVQVFTENAAPLGSGLSVVNVQAELVLPPGADRVTSTNYAQPGDDPLRFARVGPDHIIQPIQSIVRPGADGRTGTADDILRLHPSESGQGEFLVEGLQEGLHVMDLKLTADLEGLAAGVVKVKGRAAGSVLVRNPSFSLAFSHPHTVRFGEPYEASVTILNTSDRLANLVNVSLSSNSLSGAILLTNETMQLGNLAPGESATATFRLRSQRTGFVSMSTLTTSGGLEGTLRLTMAVDERGVALSPDSIGMPHWTTNLSGNVLAAAQRVLGQALSVATAGRLPANVTPVPKSIITRRVLDLAEAGQRIRYGDQTNRTLVDLLLDWQGGRSFDEGFDEILRETDAGREFREALISAIEASDSNHGVQRSLARAADLAGRGETWHLASASTSLIDVSITGGGESVSLDQSGVVRSAGYRGQRGHWFVTGATNHFTVRWQVISNTASAEIGLLVVGTNGMAEQLRWNLGASAAREVYRYAAGAGSGQLQVDADGDGQIDSTLAATRTSISELSPQVINTFQDIRVLVDRPVPYCQGPYDNYGTILAVLFSKPMRQEDVTAPGAFVLDNGNSANSVRMQPGGRVALVHLKQGIGMIRDRTIAFSHISDVRGNPMPTTLRALTNSANQGIAIRGRVLNVDGSPAATVPVTLTMYDFHQTEVGCVSEIIRTSQVFTDTDGYFFFDFVMAGIGYTLSATDTSKLTEGTTLEFIQALLDSEIDKFDRQRLRELAERPNVRDALLQAFNTDSFSFAIAAAEGLDRSVFRDSVAENSPRIGTEVPVVLRFRGRGTVTGRVLAANGTPIPAAAVNLFPDPDSRELGRGVLSDSDGRFAFFGVPLGIYSIKVATSDERQRTISGFFDMVAQTNHHEILVPDNVVPLADVRGRVVERDGLTPHANARVFIGKLIFGKLQNVVAAVTTDADGFWMAPNVPQGDWDIIAISSDGRRKGERFRSQIMEGTNYVLVQLQGTTTVRGQVVYDDGVAVTNALVAGGEALVRTDANGAFTLSGVPTGQRTINAGVEAQYGRGGIARIGSAEFEVLPGFENIVVVRLPARGRLTGTVYDSSDPPRPIPYIRVSIPLGDGFLWVKADATGRYVFDNMALGDYIISAPSPPVSEDPEAIAARTIEAIKAAESEDQIVEAVSAGIGAIVKVLDGKLNPEPFNPIGWGYTRSGLTFDGATVQADIVFLPSGTIAGRTINSQGAPLSATVQLKGLGPSGVGAPALVPRGTSVSDPTDGGFSFSNAALAGKFVLSASASFSPLPVQREGFTSADGPNSTNNVIQFPAAVETSGRLTGFVLNADGTPVGAGVKVHISFAPDYVIQTDTNGFFDTEIKLPTTTYTVIATNEFGVVGRTEAFVRAGVVNRTTVMLLDKTAALSISVKLANGAPATNATVKVKQGTFPLDSYEGATDANGNFVLQNIYQGIYFVEARQVVGTTAVSGRAGASAGAGEVVSIEVVLGASGTIRGVFLANDRATPVAFAQVAAGNLGFAATDESGRFEFPGMPFGTHQLRAQNAVNGRVAVGVARLLNDGETNEVVLVERDLGEITGLVIASDQTNIVTGAEVMLVSSGLLSPTRTVTTGPDGRFSFPGTPAGGFSLSAFDPISELKAQVNGVLPEQTPSMQVNIVLPPLATLPLIVLRPDGRPASNATARLETQFESHVADADESGRLTFDGVKLNRYTLTAQSLIATETRSLVQTQVSLTVPGLASNLVVTLPGVGTISGRVLDSSGTLRVPGAELRLRFRSRIFASFTPVTFTDTNGNFSFLNVPLDEYDLSASSLALASHHVGRILADGQHNEVDLILSASGTVQGRLVRSDGTNALPGVEMLVTFQSQTSASGRASGVTDGNGFFSINRVPAGNFTVGAVVPPFNGIVLVKSALTNNGQMLDLGDLRLDEANPTVVSVLPADTAVEIPITNTVELLFSETLDTNSVNTSGIFLRSITNTVAATLQVLPDPTNGLPRLVRLRPLAPLQSETAYEVVVVNGERRDPIGQLIGSGPTDAAGRPLLAAFVSRFTTADNDPPFIVSQTPATNAIQIDPRVVIRLVYNEPLRPTNITITLTGPDGTVSGRTDIGPDLKVLVFTPTNELKPNVTYTFTVDGVYDLVGNPALNHPFTSSFTTLDTLGPAIAMLRIAENRAPVKGAPVEIEAVLATNEPAASVRFTADVNAAGITLIGSAIALPYRVPFTLPTTGSVTFRAIATDRFGNDGVLAETNVVVVTNQFPTIQLARVNPLTGPVETGDPFSISVSANDDFALSNVTVVALGAIMFSTNLPSGSNTVLNFTVPATTLAGTPLQFQAQAIDALGARSPVTNLDFQITDGTQPTLEILSPANNALLDPGVPLNLEIAVSDNDTNIHLEFQLQGAITTTQRLDLAISPNTTTSHVFVAALTNATASGGAIQAIVRAIDRASNFRDILRTFHLPDTRAPRLTLVTPENGTTNISLWAGRFQFFFDDAIDPASVTTNTVLLTNSAGVANSYSLSTLFGSVQVLPLTPLHPGVAYTATLLPGLTDDAGHPWVNTNGASVPPDGLAFSFTTARILEVQPTNNTPVVGGQSVEVVISFERGLGADRFRLALNSNAPVFAELTSSFTQARGAILLPPDLTEANIAIGAVNSLLPVYNLPLLTLNVRPRSGDDDGDGMPNGYEADHGLNPFANDAALDPDSDGLLNSQEFALGTNPQDADTDNDNLNDGAEVALGCADPLNPDTDGDGLFDGEDTNPCGVTIGISLAIQPTVTVTEGQVTNLVFSVNSSNAPLAEVKFSTTNSPPSFAAIGALQITNGAASGVAGGRLVLSPLLDEAGTYTITLSATATNGSSGTTNITVTVLDNSALLSTRWINPVDGNWSAATNWSDGLPDSNKVAVITSPGTYTVFLNTNARIAGLILGGVSGTQTLTNNDRLLTLLGRSAVRTNAVFDLSGIRFFGQPYVALDGTGDLAVAGRLKWFYGGMSGEGRTTVLPAGTLEIRNNADKILSRPLHNGGTVVTSGNLIITNAAWNNLAGGTVIIEPAARFSGGGASVMTNEGTLTKIGTSSAHIGLGLIFHNLGTIDVTRNTLTLFSPGIHRGAIRVADGATIEIGGGGFHFQPGSILAGAGNANFFGGTNTIEGTIALTGTNIVSGGLALFNAPTQSVPRIELTGGILGGAAHMRASESFRWTGGTLAGPGTTLISTGATLTLISGNLMRSLAIAGVASMGGGLRITNASLTILPLATCDWSGLSISGTGGEINSSGRINQTNGTSTVSTGVLFNNDGVLNVLRGGININGGGINLGSITVSNATTATIDGPFSFPAGSTLTGAGRVTFQSSALPVTVDTALEFSGTLVIATRVVFNVDQTFNTLELDSAGLEGPGLIAVTGSLFADGGGMFGSGRTVVAAGGTIQPRGTLMLLTRTLDNAGLVSAALANWFVPMTNGVFNNLAGAVFDAAGRIDFGNLFGQPTANNSGFFQNIGAFNKRSANPVTFHPGITFHNSGSLSVTQGVLAFLAHTTNAAQINLGANGTLRFSNGVHRVLSGSTYVGNGAMQFLGANQLSLSTQIDFGALNVSFADAAEVSGNHTILNTAGGVITFSNSIVIPGSMNIAGTLSLADSNLAVTIQGTLTLEPGSVLNNPGMLTVGEFVDNGGTIIGHLPTEGGGGGAALVRIDEIVLNGGAGQRRAGFAPAALEVLLRWTAPAGQSFTVEGSVDLKTWTTQPAAMAEHSAGRYEARIHADAATAKYFRLRRR